ncbi:MAG TPA: hypothetical protein V6C58_11750 [Allocoleopsis sp.]
MVGQILTTVAQKALVLQTSFYHVRFYSLTPQIKIIIFAKMGLKTSYLAVSEVETMVNLVITEFGLNPYLTIWIEDQSDYSQALAQVHYSLIAFDWHNQQATNCRKLSICESWYLSWLENEVICSKF